MCSSRSAGVSLPSGRGSETFGVLLCAGGFVVPGFWGWGFVAVFYAVVEVEVGGGTQALVVEAGQAQGFF
jgi:hypothetical protein